MPDITMCCNYDCPLKARCYRYRAVPDDYQSFAMFEPKTRSKKMAMVVECDYFWQVDEIHDRTLPTSIVDNRYERDEKWKGIK